MRARAGLVVVSQWVVLGAAVGVLAGAASALFLWLLERATTFRTGHELVVYALPIAGLGIGWFYARHGRSVAGGNDLVIDAIHDGGPALPTRMAPMVLVGTVLTHLFGGSAGREGTAVQMGASLSDWLAHRFRVSAAMRSQLVLAGAAGGFGSVFGTPLAGAVFGLEFVVLGRPRLRAIVPALVASLVGDLSTRTLGIGHAVYPQLARLGLSAAVVARWLVFAVAIALVTTVFIELTAFLKRWGVRRFDHLGARMFLGGCVVVALWRLVGTSDYLGLGVPGILGAFEDAGATPWAFALKLLFTAVTLAAGFLGGEVTPLFFVGATLGSVLGAALGLPVPMAAGVGLAAVFATASNTPIALSIMAVELFGPAVLPHAAIVCVVAYVLVGHRSIYSAQRLRRGKLGQRLDGARTLREL